MDNYLFERYSRQIFIDEIGSVGQEKILDAKVLVIGAGGLGSPVIQYLAATGVGILAVADFDEVELHNLNRQVIHNEESIGKKKVKSAAQYVRSFNKRIDFKPIFEKITLENAEVLFRNYDIIVDGSDNFTTRYLINDVCVALKKPLVYASVLSFEGQVTVFNYKGSKNLKDLFPQAPKENTFNCESKGVMGALTGVVGSLMAMLVIKLIVGIKIPVNKLLILDAKDWRFDLIDY